MAELDADPLMGGTQQKQSLPFFAMFCEVPLRVTNHVSRQPVHRRQSFGCHTLPRKTVPPSLFRMRHLGGIGGWCVSRRNRI